MSGPPLDMSTFDPTKLPAITRNFVEKINAEAEEEGREILVELI